MKDHGAAELENSICTFFEKHQIMLGGPNLKPPKSEQIFIAIITIFLFLFCADRDINLLLIVCALR